MKKFSSIFCLAVAVIALGACETMQGFGQDVEDGGEAIQRSAR